MSDLHEWENKKTKVILKNNLKNHMKVQLK